MSKLPLVVLAAGIGSRFGGIKQIATVDEAEQTLIDYSVFDAVKAGFDQVICVLTPELESEFHDRIGRQIARQVDLIYAHQTLDLLPEGYQLPAGRAKPWGTAHAVLAALPLFEGSFATVNADDFYGAEAYQMMADYLQGDNSDHALVGYNLASTLSPNGTVSRGVCRVDTSGRLQSISERKALKPVDGGAVDETETFFDDQTLASLNFWGFRPSAAQIFQDLFPDFLNSPDILTNEFYLPEAASFLIPNVQVLPTTASWMGITYAKDLPTVRQHVAKLVADGLYPPVLWP